MNPLKIQCNQFVVQSNGREFDQPESRVRLLSAEGVAYKVGVAFLVTDSYLEYGHLIWHLCVIAETSCHYFAVL